MFKTYTTSKSSSINRDSSLNERLGYLTDTQLLYWNLIGQNKLIQPKIRPTNSTTKERSKASQKDVILTNLLKSKRWRPHKRRKDGKTRQYSLNDFIPATFTYYKVMYLNSISFLPIQCLLPTTVRENHSGSNRAVLITVWCSPNINSTLTHWICTNITVYIKKNALYYYSIHVSTSSNEWRNKQVVTTWIFFTISFSSIDTTFSLTITSGFPEVPRPLPWPLMCT